MQQQPKKQCPKCHRWLSYSDFHINRAKRDGLAHQCKKCQAEYDKKRDAVVRRREWLRYAYGITTSQYDSLFAKQHGKCAACGTPKGDSGHDGLVVDHDHKNGDVRALLCSGCNQALGLLNEDPERIRALLRYAEWCQTRESNTKITQLSLLEPDQLQQRLDIEGQA